MSHPARDLPAQFLGSTLPEIFEHVARAHPDNIAVADDRGRLTYRELDARAQRLAAALRRAGAARDGLVALCLERSCDLVVGILGILKAGSAYVPLDPSYPAERRHAIAAASGVTLVVANAATRARCEGLAIVDVGGDGRDEAAETDVPAGPQAQDLAYVIFTSGSSGQPKGVMVEHRNVVRLFTATDAVFGFGASDVWCLFHSTAFDFSVWELWGALLFGGRLVVALSETVRDPVASLALLAREKVTVLNQTPSAFRNLVAADANASVGELSLRWVVFGGERLDASLLAPWVARHGLSRPKLVNMYGITETTVHVTYKVLDDADIAGTGGHSAVGTPIADLQIDIADIYGHSVAPGREGLIHVSGAGLARGYLGQPALTNERFVQRTDASGRRERWYNSGDLGVQLSDGTYAYVGRADRQVKIRGYRIEPAEVESCLKQHPGVHRAIVLAADFADGDPRLVAYVIPRVGQDAPADLPAALQVFAAKALPAYMVPSLVIPIAAVPTTVNGKQDDAALRAMLQERLARTEHRATGGAAGPTELRAIWADVLALDAIDDEADFFDLGGTSFSLISLLRRVNATFGTNLQVDIFSNGATLSALNGALTLCSGDRKS